MRLNKPSKQLPQKTAATIMMVFAGAFSAVAQQEVIIDVSSVHATPVYALTLENFAGTEPYENGHNSYLLFLVRKAAEHFEDPAVQVSSSNEQVISSFTDIIGDSLKVYYDHPDSTFEVTLDIVVSGSSCSELHSFDYSFVNGPPEVSQQSFTIDENSHPGSTVGTITATDPDQNDLSYTLVSSDPEGAFRLDSETGLLTVLDSSLLNFESTAEIQLLVAASDGRLIREAEITVDVRDVNDAPVIETNDFEIGTDLPAGAVLGRVVAVDEDSDPLIFSIVEGNDEDMFRIDEENGELQLAEALDDNVGPEYPLTILVSDGELADQGRFLVKVVRVTGVSVPGESIKVYPNPVNDYLFVNAIEPGQVKSIRVTDLSGRAVEAEMAGETIDFRGVASGVYILSITLADHELKFSIIKN